MVSAGDGVLVLFGSTSTPHGGQRLLLRSGQDEVILYRSHVERQLPPSGPLQEWDAKAGRIKREFLLPTDEIVIGDYSVRPRDHVLIRREERLLLVDLATERVLGTFNDVADIESYAVDPDRRVVIVKDRDFNLRCFEFDQETPRWVLSNASSDELVDGDQLAVGLWKSSRPRSFSRVGGALVDLQTGEIDRRFDALGNVWSISLSPDGRLAVISLRTHSIVCDTATVQELWRFTLTGETFRFSPDGRDLVFWRNTDLGPVGMYCRRALDGETIQEQPPAELLRELPSGGVDYLVRGNLNQSSSKWQVWVNRYNSLCTQLRAYALLVDLSKSRWLVDAKTGRKLGGLPGDSNLTFVDNRTALVAVTPTHVNYYVLPPRRNYEWLAGWILGPVLVWMGVRGGWRLLARRGARAELSGGLKQAEACTSTAG